MKQLLQERFAIGTLETIVDRPGTAVYRAQYQGQPVSVKVFSLESAFVHETDALTHLFQKGAPVPRLIETAVLNDRYVMVQEWWESDHLRSVYPNFERSRQENIVYECGQLLAQFQFALSREDLAKARFWHRFDFNDLDQFTCREYLQAQVHKILGRLKWREGERELGLERYCALVKQKVDNLSEPERITITHNDFGLRNILISKQGDRLLGVIDFEGVQVGDPMLDLAKFTWNDVDMQDTEIIERFLAGWEDVSGLKVDRERLTLYQAYFGMGSIGWVDKQPELTAELEAFRASGVRVLRHFGEKLL